MVILPHYAHWARNLGREIKSIPGTIKGLESKLQARAGKPCSRRGADSMIGNTNKNLPMRALLAGARRKEGPLIDLARKLVLAESPSNDKAAMDA